MAHILLGVTGSIAAFKAAHLASDWTKQGHEVRVVMTDAATRFVAPLTFASLTHAPVRGAMFPSPTAADLAGDVADGAASLAINHVTDAAWADIIVVAPASADAIARIAAGLGDDALAATILAYDQGPKVLCLAMNTHMYANPVTQRNLETCRRLGWTIVEPESGTLACGDTGRGRMEEPGGIEAAVAALLAGEAGQAGPDRPRDGVRPLAGLEVLVTAGPTQEPLDPVRYLTNHSTGKMGYAIAEAARDLGARVVLVSGPVALPAPEGVDLVRVTTAQEMFDAVRDAFPGADVTVMAAAVGDFRVAEVEPDKIKKHGRDAIELRLVANPDILAWAGAHRRANGSQTLCGFAMETRDLEANAAAKLAAKRCDMLVANDLREPGAGFGTDTNAVTVLTPGDAPDKPHAERWQLMGKREVAERLLLRLAAMREGRA
ncbi:bifunctional phosphopantothenoylcysteine decarboxylase/phosphopantothenate--cysteine ligase CoaBC [Bifidobacterium pullorum subsp. saeculare]|uniref:Coenzyme A biosynthesis bifunctional protein CoaBC n=1 Tax=Bifidobacterium pullorum subsp. saeculare TaxID=78257 RepID=A0A938WWC3_9BIFI|nr:bifunctional phosphopantothenoylcysteine decarboxylase/phosphopantothenate--cysteine ligase CoaBC [Bifidobacterium pullorum]MBM6698773.1 bifunctional phosphopantothenoylcysteine decarboxylase/phosphopantothenate--cysteine ligase CoaBC [Bifidobacterium pullorum subsp. saeculare]